MSEPRKLTSAPLWRSVLHSLATRVLTLPIGLIQGVVLARQLHPAGLGRYSALLTDLNLGVAFLSLGLPGALVVLIGERPQRLRRLLRMALLWGAAMVLLPGLALSLYARLGRPIPGRAPVEISLIALGLLCQFTRDVLNSLLWGTQQFQSQNWQAMLMVTVQLGVMVALSVAGWLDPHTALGVQIGAGVFTATLAGWSLYTLAGRAGLWQPDAAEDDPLLARALGIGLRSVLHMLPGMLLLRADVYLIQELLPRSTGQGQLGIYQAGVRIGELVLMVPGTLNSVLFAKAAAREDVVGTTVACAKISLYLGLACFLGMAAIGQPLLLLLYGPQYGGSFGPCLLVLLGCCWFCLSTPLSGTLAGDAGYPRSIILAEVAALVVNVGLNLYLIPHHGVIGAAAASTAAYFVGAALLTAAFALRYGVSARALLWPESPLTLLRRVRGL